MKSVTLELRKDQYLELEKLGIGAFHPIKNFMTETEFFSVVKNMRLPSQEVFPLPIILDVNKDFAQKVINQEKINLKYLGKNVGEIIPESIFTCDKIDVAQEIYGTSDNDHPGVKRFYEMGDWFIGGKTTLLLTLDTDISKYELSPDETKKIFTSLGWEKIVGFQTRNVPHKAHEYLQRVALEHVDGLFLQPLVGQKKKGDYTANAIMEGYKKLISSFYPKKRVVMGILSTSMRYAGPREAVFHALVRRNYGCTHFIVGRDHAGVGKYYKKYEAHDLLKVYEKDLGINIMYLHGPYYCTICEGIVTEHTCPHYTTSSKDIIEISGTSIRKMLSGGLVPDSRFIRPEILGALKNIKLFIEN
jgi:sulfate adenylyltransferase